MLIYFYVDFMLINGHDVVFLVSNAFLVKNRNQSLDMYYSSLYLMVMYS